MRWTGIRRNPIFYFFVGGASGIINSEYFRPYSPPFFKFEGESPERRVFNSTRPGLRLGRTERILNLLHISYRYLFVPKLTHFECFIRSCQK